MNPADRIPNWTQLRQEAAVLQRLVECPPWIQLYEPHDVDTAVRASFRRWAPAEVEPSVLMIQAIWERAENEAWLQKLPTEQQQHTVSRLARTLHLFALAPEEGPARSSFGAACAFQAPNSKAPIISRGRFARLVNPPPDTQRRLESLGRAFRHFRQKGVRVKSEDAEKLLAFLYTDDPKSVVARWANDYFGRPAAEEATAEPSETPSSPVTA